MNPMIKNLGKKVLNVVCKPRLFQECMRTYCSLYGDYKFVPSEQNVTIQQALMSYHFDDVRKTDTVLDIGAHVGGFSIPVSAIANRVISIEPTYCNELVKNVEINKITNIEVVHCGLGEGFTLLGFNGKSGIVHCYNLKYIIDLFCGGHVDFLKIDCEGGEWNIKPSDLDGIRRIEGEIHFRDPTSNGDEMFEFVDMLKETGYDVEVGKNNGNNMIFHAVIKPLGAN